jgi:hypothetical protein
VKNYSEEEIRQIVKESWSKSDICRKLGLPINGSGLRTVDKLVGQLDTSHFSRGHSNIKYPRITKRCPVCDSEFKTSLGHRKEKDTCSHGCANAFFRSGENNGNFGIRPGTRNNYRRVCFSNNEKKCIIHGCGEARIVEVHHIDGDRNNNSPDNLIPLCPTHHAYCHSRFKYLIEDQIKKFKKDFGRKLILQSVIGKAKNNEMD